MASLGFSPKSSDVSFGRRHYLTAADEAKKIEAPKRTSELPILSPKQAPPAKTEPSDLRYQVQAQTMTEMAKQLVASEAETKRARGLCFKTLFVCQQWQHTAHVVWRAVGRWQRAARAAAHRCSPPP